MDMLLKSKRLLHDILEHLIYLRFKKRFQDPGSLSESHIKTQFAQQIFQTSEYGSAISRTPCQLLFLTWYGFLDHQEGGVANVKQALPPNLLSELGFQEMKQFQMFWSVAARPKPKTMIADGSSERIYEQIPSLNRSENNVLLLLAWSSECTGRVLRALHAWAVSTHGQAVYRRLVEHLGLPSTPAQVALDLVALLSFLRLQPYGSSRTDEAKANHLSDFHSLLKGSPSSKARETIEHETWSFCIATSSWIDADEVQRMFQLLACVFDVVSIPECSDEDSGRYWTGRFNPPRSHDSALLTMPDVVGNFTLAVQPDLPRLNGNGSIIESEFATDGSSQAVANRSSEVLMQSSNEKVSKRRSCFRWGWFCGAM